MVERIIEKCDNVILRYEGSNWQLECEAGIRAGAFKFKGMEEDKIQKIEEFISKM